MPVAGVYEINQRAPGRRPRARVALVFPDIYPFAVSSYTFQFLYALVSDTPGLACERFTYPLTRAGLQDSPRSLDSGCALDACDVVLVTFQVEADYFRFTWFLQAGGLAVARRRRDQQQDANPPLVIAGGPAPSANPCPVLPVVDGVVVGDVEPAWESLSAVLAGVRETSREVTLAGLADVPGFLTEEAARAGPRVRRNTLRDLDASPHPVAQVLPEALPPAWAKAFPFKRSFLLEVNRGCPNACAFCITGHQKNPLRHRRYVTLDALLTEGCRATRVPAVTFIGSAVNLHPQFTRLVQRARDLGLRVRVPSLTTSRVTPEQLTSLARANLTTITLAPETCASLRPSIAKSLSDATLLDILARAREAGLKHVKLYFLAGLPGERDHHIPELADLVERVWHLFPEPRATRVSLNPLVPKANTPLERFVENYASTGDLKELQARVKRLGLLLRNGAAGRSVKYNPPRVKDYKVQAYLSLAPAAFHALLAPFARHLPSLTQFEKQALRAGIKVREWFEGLPDRVTLPWHVVAD